MSQIRVSTNFNIDLEFEAAPFHRRGFALIIDIVILILYVILSARILSEFSGDVRWFVYAIFLVPFLCYHLIMEIFMNGQTIGKKIMRLQVVNENGGSASIGQYVIRWLIRTSDYMVILIMLIGPALAYYPQWAWYLLIPLGLLITDMILVNVGRQQRLGDILAHTFVIHRRKDSHIHDTVFLHVEDSYVPSFPEIMRLSDKDINTLKGILDIAKKRGDYNMAETAMYKVTGHLSITTHMSAFDFLETLLKDYNYLSAR